MNLTFIASMSQSRLAICLFAAGCLASSACTPGGTARAPATDSASATEQSAAQADPERLDPAVVDACKAATVLVGNFEDGTFTSSGTGFVCDDGMTVLTNKHVVTGTDDRVDTCKLMFGVGTPNAKIVTVQPDRISTFAEAKRDGEDYHFLDAAAIRLDEKIVEPLRIGDSADLSETEAVWAFGFPLGLEMRTANEELPSPTVHVMRIERLQKTGEKAKVLQLSGSPTYGVSGGAVVTRDGTVVGIIQAKAVDSSILFAVPTPALKDMMARARAPGDLRADWYAPVVGPQPNLPPAAATRPNRATDLAPRLVGSSVLSEFELTDADLDGLTARELTLIRNEPFARRGYIFQRADLRQFYSQFEWYSMRTRDLGRVQAQLTRLERRNVDLIRNYQHRKGLEW